MTDPSRPGMSSCTDRPSLDEHQRFFRELAPRLQSARELERELDIHLARRFNVFDYLPTDEMGLSQIIADLLDPKGKHGQGASFLKLLIDECGLEGLVWSSSAMFADVEVDVEKTIEDDRRLDIYVRIGSSCLAIENKPYARDQPNQVRDYLDWLGAQGFKNHALIYLSPSGGPPSSESVESSDLERIDHFKIMAYHSAGSDEWEDGFDDCRLKYTLGNWLSDCRKNCNVDRLCWFLREAETFCERKFGGHTVGSNELDAIRKFVGTAENWDVGLAVHRALPDIVREVYCDFIQQIGNTDPKKTKYDYPEDIAYWWNYHSPKTKSYLGMYRDIWKSNDGSTGYRNVERYTQIRLEAESEIGGWFIGVRSETPELINKNEQGFKELKAALTHALGEGESDRPNWVWWQRIDRKYSEWTSIIPALREDSENGEGEFLMYFVEKFASISKVAVPIIDRYEGT